MNALRGPEIELFAYDQNDSVNKCQWIEMRKNNAQAKC